MSVVRCVDVDTERWSSHRDVVACDCWRDAAVAVVRTSLLCGTRCEEMSWPVDGLQGGIEDGQSAFAVQLPIEEDDAIRSPVMLDGFIKASSHRSPFNSALIIAALEITQQFVATISEHALILCCVATMVVVLSSDSAYSRISGDTIQSSGNAIHYYEQDLGKICSRTSYSCLSLSDGLHVEDVVSILFGLCHRRWTTTPPLLILRFNSGDVLSLSSVKPIRDLRLNSTPRGHFPDRPLGEPPTGHQLDSTSNEAFKDCSNCRRIIFSIFFTSLDQLFVVLWD